MKKVLLCTISIIIILVGCKKEELPDPIDTKSGNFRGCDTIKPLSYLPAYPGSYWIYSNGDTIKTSDSYELHTLYEKAWITSEEPPYYPVEECVEKETAYFPIYDNKILKGYKQYSIVNSPTSYCETLLLLCESLGAGWTINYTTHDRSSMLITKKDTTIALPNNVVYNNVIVAEYNYTINSSPIIKKEYYYAKDIGLIQLKTIYALLGPGEPNTIDWYLTDYFIAAP